MNSPKTPRHSRHSSNIDISFTTPQSTVSRRQSKASIHSPLTPGRSHFPRRDSLGPERDVFSSGGPGVQSNGSGNLADELADAWESGEEDEEVDLNFQTAGLQVQSDDEVEPTRDSGVDISSSPIQLPVLKPANSTLSPPTPVRKGHKRQPSDYDGSDYGGDSDLDNPGMPPALVARMDMVESLARRGTENNGTERDGVVKRVTEGLKDLGGQSGVEGGATRLITAHSALSSHLHHQTRLLHSLAYPIISPQVAPPDEEFLDEIISLLITLSETLPRPTSQSLASLTQLHTQTAELVQTLNGLSDTLHMSRQTTTTATRRLKSARELVQEMRKEEEQAEEGERWLKKGNWGERLQRREAGKQCRDVVGGFEEVCEGWRRRLIAQSEAVG